MFGMLTKWFSSTRLETRTKESNIYASIWVFKTLMRNESKGSCWVAEVGSPLFFPTAIKPEGEEIIIPKEGTIDRS